MELISLENVLFITVLVCVYYLLGRRLGRYQWAVILVANFAFCYLTGGTFAMVFVVVATLPTWLASQAFGRLNATYKTRRKATKDRTERKTLRARLKRNKRIVLVACLAVILGVLGYFKYWNTILFNFGLAPSATSLGIMLPLGISFYTFQAASYVIDTYNDKYAPERNLLLYLTFVSYFPCLIQGPINHYDVMVPQLRAERSFDGYKARRGLLRMGLGLIKKCAIANVLVGNVNAIVNHVTTGTPGAVVVLGVLLYSFQMYGDFSGGIDLVEGASELLGVEMQQNFRQPYLSTSLADFWRRWHMSLGVCVRDYLFYPIAVTRPMQRLGKWATKHLGRHLGRTLPACVANIITFLFVGLWHGAEWHYVAWGLYNGIVVALSDLLSPCSQWLNRHLHLDETGMPHRVIAVIRTFILVNIGRYFDCIPEVGQIGIAFHNTLFYFMPEGGLVRALASMGVAGSAQLGFSVIAFVALAFVFVVDLAEECNVDVRATVLAWRFPLRLVLYLFVLVLLASCFNYTVVGGASFMYANF